VGEFTDFVTLGFMVKEAKVKNAINEMMKRILKTSRFSRIEESLSINVAEILLTKKRYLIL
jgi:hypothetical protein